VPEQPLISVYLPTRNRAALLPRAIGSVLSQTHRDFELLAVDDASTDDTWSILCGFAARDPRVRIFRLDQQSGAPVARNRAIREARGPFITGLDDDDEMLPERLAVLLAAHRDEHAFVCSASYLNAGGWVRLTGGGDGLITLSDQLYSDKVGNQVFARTERFRAVGMFDESMLAWQDYDLWTRLIQRFGPALRIKQPTYVVRRNEGFSRVSENASRGARQYYEKFRAQMSPGHEKSQLLHQLMLDQARLTLGDAWRFWTPHTRRLVVRYWVATNLPFAMPVFEAYRRWRYAPPT
jgi:glycosyltransferase involved in cell wall biosynthesis